MARIHTAVHPRPGVSMLFNFVYSVMRRAGGDLRVKLQEAYIILDNKSTVSIGW